MVRLGVCLTDGQRLNHDGWHGADVEWHALGSTQKLSRGAEFLGGGVMGQWMGGWDVTISRLYSHIVDKRMIKAVDTMFDPQAAHRNGG